MFAASLLTYPIIDPVLIELGPLAIRWYALAYLAGIGLGYYVVATLNRSAQPPLLSKAQLDDIMLWAVLGIIIGGRLGYVLFYKPDYYAQHLLEIPQLWKGGMAFHGGLIGAALGFYGFARKHGISYLRLMDWVVCAAPIGLFFGRLANFINGELYGRVADCAVCMVFPHGGDLARHPSQLYQAGLEGLLLFALLFILRRSNGRIARKAGGLCGTFLIGYATARFGAEFFREPDAHLGLLGAGLSMGQWLCLPMAALGLYLLLLYKPKPSTL